MFPREKRLHEAAAWRHVRRRGRCARSRHTVLCVAPSDRERFGFSTTKGFGNAVCRNKARRRLREAFRCVYGVQAQPLAVTGTAHPESLDLDFAALCEAVRAQLEELGLNVRGVQE